MTSKALTYKDYVAAVNFDAEDEIFIGFILGINDVVGFHASTVKGLKSAFHDAVDDYLETCAKIGKDPEKRMSGNLMLRVAPEVHAKASLAAQLEGKSLNQWAEEVFRKVTDTKAFRTLTEKKKTARGKPLRTVGHRRSRTARKAG
jgi:predicted HicB family RNase H-like nuclease